MASGTRRRVAAQNAANVSSPSSIETPPKENVPEEVVITNIEPKNLEPQTIPAPRQANKRKRKAAFENDLRLMLYGYGDVPNPDPETVELLEEITVNYIVETAQKAAAVASRRGKLKTEDVVFVVRKDPKKVARVEELLFIKEEIDRAQKVFDARDIEKDEQEKPFLDNDD